MNWGRRASHGTDPCHLMVDRSGRNVLVANFASGSVCVLPIAADGSLEEASCVIQHKGSSVDPKRQVGPHAHAIEIDAANRYVFVPDLGCDSVMIYELDAEKGMLTPNRNQPAANRTVGDLPHVNTAPWRLSLQNFDGGIDGRHDLATTLP